MPVSDAYHRGSLDGGLAKLNAGGSNPTGYAKFKTASSVLIATAALSNPAFQPAVTLAGPPIEHRAAAFPIQPSDAPTPDAVIGRLELCDRGNTMVLDMSVGLSGSGATIIVDVNQVPTLAANITITSLVIRTALTAA